MRRRGAKSSVWCEFIIPEGGNFFNSEDSYFYGPDSNAVTVLRAATLDVLQYNVIHIVRPPRLSEILAFESGNSTFSHTISPAHYFPAIYFSATYFRERPVRR